MLLATYALDKMLSTTLKFTLHYYSVQEPYTRFNKTGNVRINSVILRRVRETIVAVEKEVLHIPSVCLLP
jgi:hypothetical protein